MIFKLSFKTVSPEKPEILGAWNESIIKLSYAFDFLLQYYTESSSQLKYHSVIAASYRLNLK